MTTAKFDSINVKAMERWLSELERDDIEQANAVLHVIEQDSVSMCCLGVASHALSSECGVKVEHREVQPGYVKVNYDGQGGYLPRAVAEYLGIPASHLEYKPQDTTTILVTLDVAYGHYCVGHQVSVAVLNDSGKFTFKDIARLLRKEFLNA